MKAFRPDLPRAFAILLIIAVATPVFAGEKQKVVYHVADAEKVQFALGNIRNHIEGVGGTENVEIILVVHGPAGKMFQDIEATDRVRNMVKSLQDDGVQFDMCGNTMRAQDVELGDLLPGFVRVDQGGVVRIAELQQQGYIYIRP
jgi:intracellular sulfur oxidation DsrE/DsrF family protein